MKKNTRRILAATCMLLISAVLLGTASFAWFGMNTDSTASGLEVEATSDSLFLEISQDGTTYENDTVFDGDDSKATLGLVTHKFFDADEIVTFTGITKITDGSRYDGTGTYYKAVVSDIGKSASAYNYVNAMSEINPPTPTTGYFKNVMFEIVKTEGKVGTGTYYSLSGNTFAQVTNADESIKGLYRIYYYTDPAFNTYKSDATYYEYDGSAYNLVDTSSFEVDVTDVSSYFVRVYDAAPGAEDATAVYDGNSVYYSYNVSNKTYTKLGATLNLGTELYGYYTLTGEAPVATPAAGEKGDGTTVYYLKNEIKTGKYDYSYIGTIGTDEIIENYLYWGRAYSNNPEQNQANQTLNVTDNGITGVQYYLNKTLYLRQAEGTNHAENLRVSGVEIGGAYNELSDAMRVLFVATSSADPATISVATYDVGLEKFVLADGTAVDEATLFEVLLGNEAEVITVQVYIYFDGTDDVAKNTDAILSGQTIEITFAINELEYNKVS